MAVMIPNKVARFLWPTVYMQTVKARQKATRSILQVVSKVRSVNTTVKTVTYCASSITAAVAPRN